MAESSLLAVLVTPDDVERHKRLAQNISKQRQRMLWDDRVLARPLDYYKSTYLHPDSLVFDICDGGGMFVLTCVQRGWRGQIIGAAWSRDAIRATHDGEVWKSCGRAAMITRDLLVLDSFTAIDHSLARRLLARMGMTLRGFIPNALCYNGTWKSSAWYEIDRHALGVVGASNGRPPAESPTASPPGV